MRGIVSEGRIRHKGDSKGFKKIEKHLKEISFFLKGSIMILKYELKILIIEVLRMGKKGRIQVVIDDEVKEEAEVILKELGMNATTAVTILYKQIIARGAFPMEIKLSEEARERIKLREVTKNLPVELLDTDEKLNAWINEE